ncbi:RTA1-domain-containing protein [Cylindrobasidium torrendii FP15055 ss-10]|uniref:RTA1-domain-containing protein n=1 Tax=Cylindrobasidium torrendii FP15055 ss-10 TaxID=1314674 RepID=A0A0D7BU95_9AGAR|nr:RTA1-domain-containing protein [Cylindrobasidium torrendii FP15055 ss-10]
MSVSMRQSAASVLALALCAAAQQYAPPDDPFADPKNDIYNPLRYIASNTLTAISFSLVVSVGISQVVLMWRYGAKWMLAMTIGCFAFSLGLGLRFALNKFPESTSYYIVYYLFVVLSPCAFIAADYVLLGRLARHLGADEFLLVTPRKITITFVSSDIITFLIQAAGGGLSTSKNPDTGLVGSRVFLAGLALQLLSFIIFTIIYARFLVLLHKRSPALWLRDTHLPWYHDWRALAASLILSCIGILIRSVYRTIELGQGFHGHLATTEAYFYGLDTLPLFIAIAVYVPFWPGRFIPAEEEAEVSSTRNSVRTVEGVPVAEKEQV